MSPAQEGGDRREAQAEWRRVVSAGAAIAGISPHIKGVQHHHQQRAAKGAENWLRPSNTEAASSPKVAVLDKPGGFAALPAPSPPRKDSVAYYC